jgi:hypothetical protein
MAIPPQIEPLIPSQDSLLDGQALSQLQVEFPSLNYDDILDLIIAVDEENLEERCTPEQIEKLAYFFTVLARNGVNDPYEGALLEQDISALLYETRSDLQFRLSGEYAGFYRIEPSIYQGQAHTLLCKNWFEKQYNHIKKFVHKHKKAIIIGAAVVVAVTIVVVAVAVYSSAAVCSSAVAVAGAAASESDSSEQNEGPSSQLVQKMPTTENQDQIQKVEQALPILDSPAFSQVIEEKGTFIRDALAEERQVDQGGWSLAEKARELGSCVAHEILDAAATLGSFVPELQEEIAGIGSRVLPDSLTGPAIPEFINRNPVECYQDTVDKLHQKVDEVFSTNQAELYTPEAKANDPLNDFAVAVIPPPGIWGELFDNNRLIESGIAINRAGFTGVGRALMKHGYREGSVFPRPVGNPVQINQQGRVVLEQILNDPQREVIYVSDCGFKIYSSSGRGASFRRDGTFRGFVERQHE